MAPFSLNEQFEPPRALGETLDRQLWPFRAQLPELRNATAKRGFCKRPFAKMTP
jgi:hypothetical protein